MCWAAVRKFTALFAKYGIQDAARKQMFPSWLSGPWAGTVCHTDNDMLVDMVS